MLMLSIESSCDETAAAVTRDGREVLSNVVASQAGFHARYGGVVPELASRLHIERINQVVREALSRAGTTSAGIDAIAVVNRPGLIGSLLVGVCAAKTLAWAWGKPLLDVDHIHGHIHSCTLEQPAPVQWPAVALVVSGGHTALYECTDEVTRRVIGRTRDDAAGEAFDKVAAILKLGYPGGPLIDRLARQGNPRAYDFPRSLPRRDDLDFSFSGLKTAVLYTVRGQPGVHRHDAKHRAADEVVGGGSGRESGSASLSEPGPTFVFNADAVELTDAVKADIAASFQAAVVDVLVRKTMRAVGRTGARSILVGGGVAANRGLRAGLAEAVAGTGLGLHFAPPSLCTDNAAMACVAYHKFVRGQFAELSLPALAG